MNLPLPPGFRLHRGVDALPDDFRGGAVAIGNFDGVHLGHKAVLGAARLAGQPAVALTFEPHPRTFFRPDQPVPRLTPPREKRLLVAREGLDGAIELAFDAALAAEPAEEFVRRVIVDAIEAQTVIVGYDFHFGRGREGSPAFLREAAARYGFDVRVIDAQNAGAQAISSSRVRGLLTDGRIEEANRLLGHRWFAMGEVVHGEKRGRALGYPTANIALAPNVPLAHGIYAVRAAFDGNVHPAVASFGRRPTFHTDAAPLLEVYVFDMARDLYGKTLAVEFISRLRGEERFADVDALIAQMHRDAVAAQRIAARPVDPQAPSAIG